MPGTQGKHGEGERTMKILNVFRSSTEALRTRAAFKRILTSRSILLLIASIALTAIFLTGPAPVGYTHRKRKYCVALIRAEPGAVSPRFKAINAAMAGDTINVAAGTYTETVTVNKQVFLRGANTGVNACGVRGAESIVQGSEAQHLSWSRSMTSSSTDSPSRARPTPTNSVLA